MFLKKAISVFLLCVAIIVLGPKSAEAEERVRVRFESLSEVPVIYTQKAYNQDNLQKLTKRIITDVRVLSGRFDYFRVRDWNYFFEKEIDKLKYTARVEQLKFDFNFDGVITLDELLMESVNRWNINNPDRYTIKQARGNKAWVSRAEKEIKRLDTNNNGQIDFDEMAFVSKEEIKRVQYSVKQSLFAYANCDFNGDGRITIAEIKEGARASFVIFDTNNDKMLNENELRKFKKRKKR